MADQIKLNQFRGLIDVCSSLNPNQTFVLPGQSLNLGFFSLDFDWFDGAIHDAKNHSRIRSSYEYDDVMEHTSCMCIGSVVVEVISDGTHALLLVDRRPVAQCDSTSDGILVVFFDYPALDDKERLALNALKASVSYFEIRNDHADHVKLCYVRQESGNLNSLRLVRFVCLNNGNTDLLVEVERSDLHEAPAIQNLVDWVDIDSSR